MKIYQALQIGEYHTNHCEDYVYVGDLGDDKILCAVMDGCTMATESYFASALVGKLLRKISKEYLYKEQFNKAQSGKKLDDLLKLILHELFKELVVARNQLLLDRNELLTTLIVLLIDKNANNGIVLVVGDGLVSINGKITEFDHDNKPDYIGFHLSKDFNSWYENQHQIIYFDSVQDITIATDGIFSFTKVKQTEATTDKSAVELLVIEKSNADDKDMLKVKVNKLEKIFGLKPTDDIGIVRIIR